MSVTIIVAPVIIVAWPLLTAAVASAAGSLGYCVSETTRETEQKQSKSNLQIEIPNTEAVTGGLGRDQKISVTKDGVTATFSKDNRGKTSLHISGDGFAEEELRVMGEELSKRVVQHYVYQHLVSELGKRNYAIVEDTAEANQAIRIKVRHWE